MLALCILCAFGTLALAMLLFFESREQKRLNSLLSDYRTRRYSDEMTLSKMEELMTSHRHHYRESVKDLRDIILDLSKQLPPEDRMKTVGKSVKVGVDFTTFEKKVDNKMAGLNAIMAEGPEQDIMGS